MFSLINPQDPRFWGLIRQLGREIGWQSPLHTRSALSYYQQRPQDNGDELDDRSFVMLWENHPVAAFIGALVCRNDGKQDLLAFEIPCHVIEHVKKLTTKASKRFLVEVDEILHEVSGSIQFRDFLIDGRVSAFSKYLLSKKGGGSPIFYNVIDLSYNESYLKSKLRKSYRSLVNWGKRELNPTVVYKEDVTWDLVDEFRQLHIRQAGRETRSEESWKRQYDMVKAGEAYIVVGYLNDCLVSAGFFMCSNTNCYYGSSASRRDLFEKPLFHSLMWTAILYAKDIGCSWFEVGEQVYPNHPRGVRPNEKEIGISDFKAGFGGETKMFLDLKLNS
jgi:hypothetical protein